MTEEYDDVWCVFDHDGRDYISKILADAAVSPAVSVAFSNPCFELWYFLHYQYSARSCNQNQMFDNLKNHISNYSKDKDVFSQLPTWDIAVTHAARLRRDHESAGDLLTDNPSTNVDVLVELLFSLQDPR